MNSLNRGESRFRSTHAEAGVALILGISVVTVILLFLAVVVTYGYHSLVQSELKSAADAAAHAGASMLCSEEECWDDARVVAARVLSEHSSHGVMAKLKNLDFSFVGGPSFNGHTWSGSNLEVSIERGRWSPASGFESFENWKLENPGVIGFVAANSVRVKIGRPASTGLRFPTLLHWQEDVSSTAISGPVRDTCAAPFAIPVCALLSQRGKFKPDNVSFRDRLFTSVARYGSSDSIDLLPAFPISPSHESSVQTRFPTPKFSTESNPENFPALTGMNFLLDERPAFNVERYDANFDNYGVVGKPGTETPKDTPGTLALEMELRNQLASGGGNGCYSAKVGDTFGILPSGLTAPESGNAIWSRISLKPVSGLPQIVPSNPYDGTHIPFYQSKLGYQEDVFQVSGGSWTRGSGVQFNSYLGHCSYATNSNCGSDSPSEDEDHNPLTTLQCRLKWSTANSYRPASHLNPYCTSSNTDDRNCPQHWCPRIYLENGFSPVPNFSPAPPPVGFDINAGLCNSRRLDQARADYLGDIEGALSSPSSSMISKINSTTAVNSVLTSSDSLANPLTMLDGHSWALGLQQVEGFQAIPASFLYSLINTPVWQVPVAVIAQHGPSAPGCQNTDKPASRSLEDTIDPLSDWRIIGFVDFIFYDSDVGRTPPTSPLVNSSTIHPYSFKNGSESCNVVRGRIKPGPNFIPSVDPNGIKKTILVE